MLGSPGLAVGRAAMIVIALGSNLAGPWGPPERTLNRTLDLLYDCCIPVRQCSSLLRTAPYGKTDQPAFLNAVAIVETHLPPAALMRRLHAIEYAAGRRRRLRWGPRTLDLDLIAYHDLVIPPPRHPLPDSALRRPLVLPHPDLHRRAFVLEPLNEIAPFWHHPVTGLTPRQMLLALPPGAGGRVVGR